MTSFTSWGQELRFLQYSIFQRRRPGLSRRHSDRTQWGLHRGAVECPSYWGHLVKPMSFTSDLVSFMVLRKEKGNFSPFPSSWILPPSSGNQTIWGKRGLAFPWAVNFAMLGQSEGVTLKPGHTVYPWENFSSSDTNTSQQNHKGRVWDGRGAVILPFNSPITIRDVTISSILYSTGDPIVTQTPTQPLILPTSHEDAGILLMRKETELAVPWVWRGWSTSWEWRGPRSWRKGS